MIRATGTRPTNVPHILYLSKSVMCWVISCSDAVQCLISKRTHWTILEKLWGSSPWIATSWYRKRVRPWASGHEEDKVEWVNLVQFALVESVIEGSTNAESDATLTHRRAINSYNQRTDFTDCYGYALVMKEIWQSWAESSHAVFDVEKRKCLVDG